MIKENLIDVHNNILVACKNSQRDISTIQLISVSKTKPIEDIKEAYSAGERNFGENKVQELDSKYDVLPNDIKWHLIGHLQRNKVKYIINKAYLIHSVDSLRLAEQIDEEAKKHNLTANILVQVNVANEDTKFGLAVEDVTETIISISKLENVAIKGLMTIAPFTDDAESNRKYFRQLKELSTKIDTMKIPHVEMKELSMGMTGDYKVAIEEGATLVRVGTGIFGNRIYNKQ